jgi:hypothetical protein
MTERLIAPTLSVPQRLRSFIRDRGGMRARSLEAELERLAATAPHLLDDIGLAPMPSAAPPGHGPEEVAPEVAMLGIGGAFRIVIRRRTVEQWTIPEGERSSC